MGDKREDGDLEPIDLSVRSRSRSASRNMGSSELEEIVRVNESREIINSVFAGLTAGSPLKSAVYVPDRVFNLLGSYGDLQSSKFYGLVSLILDTALDSLYDEAYYNVFATLVNDYLEEHELDLAKRWESGLVEGSRAYVHSRQVIASFRSFPQFIYDDVKAYKENDTVGARFSSALALSDKLESARLKILDLQKDLVKVKSDYSNSCKALHKDLNDRNLRISDLTGMLSALKNDKTKSDEFRYYHFAVPRVFRILRAKFLRGLASVKKRFSR